MSNKKISNISNKSFLLFAPETEACHFLNEKSNTEAVGMADRTQNSNRLQSYDAIALSYSKYSACLASDL